MYGNPAGDGASNSGAQDRSNHIDYLEERSALRRPTSETTNSLSVSSHPFHPWDSSRAVARVLETLGFEGESQPIS